MKNLFWMYGKIDGFVFTRARKNRFTKRVQIHYFNETFNYFCWIDVDNKYKDKFIQS
jgi:hypothetical protein